MSKKELSKEELAKRKKKQTWVIMISTIVVLLVIAGIVMIVLQNKDKVVKSDGGITYTGQPSIGKADAPVRIAEFGDYKCIFCHQFEMNTYPKLKKDFIDTGKVKFYFMNYTIIAQDSVNAANAGEAIFSMYPDHFWDFHKLMYENQGPETETWVTNDLLMSLAKKAVPNLNEAKFKSAIEQGTYIDQIKTDVNMGKAAGVNGTPSVFINGKLVPGQDTLDYNSLKGYIQKALNGETK